jgi:hypothetical protein
MLEALRFLCELEVEKTPRMRRAPLGVVSKPWRRFVLGANHDVDRRYYTFCTLERLQDALRRRDVFVAPSERWSDPRAKLLHGLGWDAVRTQVCRTLGRGEVAQPELQQLTAELNEAYQRTAVGLSANAAARIERTDGQDRLVLTGLDKIDEPASLVELLTLVQELMPRVDLPELLLEVNAWTGFANQFTHVSEGPARVESLPISICTALLAEACNVGLEPLVRHDVAALTRGRLGWVLQNYPRAETLTPANARLVDYQNTLWLAQQWGGGEVASQTVCASWCPCER